ncbi:MAG: family 10 glycosylhydrolase [Clostridia bacterium]|nr:family 10 glycosylhydrolase [Clostridia bacterium]
MTKRIFALLLALFMLAGLCACGDGEDTKDDATQAGTQSQPQNSEDSSAAENSGTAENSNPAVNSSDAESSDAESSDAADSSEEEKPVDKERKPLNYEYMKGTWLYQYSGTSLFREDGKQRDEAEYRQLVEQICANLQRDGYNTLFLQVRGHGDSFYPSELYPPSRYAVEDYDSEFDYDPFEIFVDIAHKHEISIHAWINPYRLLLVNQIISVPDNYAIKKWFNEKEGDYIVQLDGRYYANPAYEEVQQLVIDGAKEICTNYNVDGLHIDDYFYPSGVRDDFDKYAYAALGNGRTLKQFRYDCVNNLVKGLYDAVHSVHPDLMFGISPAGNMDNNRGYLSADIDTWCTTPGYIDYIAPQVYWSFNYVKDFAKFDICSTSWGNLVTCKDVKLVLGIGLYRTMDAELSQTDPGWFLYKDNLKRILEWTYDFEPADGFIMFDYCSMYDIYTGEYREQNSEEIQNMLPLLKGQD